MKTIGLIGGMSWESSAVYYQIINRKTKEILGGSHSAKSLMYSVDFGETGVETSEMPKPNDTSFLLNKLGYYMHDGPHAVLPDDWTKFIAYMKKYL